MPRPYTILEGIDVVYNYIIRNMDLEPSEDLYQDIACEYIHLRNSGKTHGGAYQSIIRHFERQCRDEKYYTPEIISIDEIVNYPADYFEKNIFDIVDENIIRQIIVDRLTPRESFAVIEKVFNNSTFDDLSKVLNVCRDRSRQIYLKGLRKLLHPSRRKLWVDGEVIEYYRDNYR